jgi:hypothetical protein
MMFWSGAPNSPEAAIRFSTSASPNIALRRRRPRAYSSLMSNFRSRFCHAIYTVNLSSIQSSKMA